MKLSFHGADQGVTGSCHLLECAGKRILIDCGMYQGGRELAQEILYYLREGVEKMQIKHFINVFLDSPMAISATQIFERHPECFDADTLKLSHDGGDPFDLPGLHFTRETSESMAINQVEGGAVIMAGSGMCTGGRVRHQSFTL